MNSQRFIKNFRLANPWYYFLATCLWTWSFLGITYWFGLNGESSIAGTGLVFLALSGPAVMAIFFVYTALNRSGQKDYWKRIVDYQRISTQWYAVIFLLVPSVSLLAAYLSGYGQSPDFFVNKLPSVMLLVLVVPLAPILEELGWRGYVLDRLQERYSALTSTFILAIVWCLWHLPAFFLPGSMFDVMPVGSLLFWLYMINLMLISVCFTWIYNNTHRSTLAAVMFHIVIEFSANKGLIPFAQFENIYNVAVWGVVAIGICLMYGARYLTIVPACKNQSPC